nr:WAS/WASL-interacting protein family member 3-like [Aegilops tauschii subsp. strangulata]
MSSRASASTTRPRRSEAALIRQLDPLASATTALYAKLVAISNLEESARKLRQPVLAPHLRVLGPLELGSRETRRTARLGPRRPRSTQTPHGVAPRPPRRPRPRPLPVAASYLSRRAHDPSAPVAPSGWCSRFASPAAAAPPSATPPPPPLFTLDDRRRRRLLSPDPTASDLLPVASSPSPRAGAGAGSRSPSWDRSRGKASAPGSPMDGVVEPPPRKELLALPPPSSPCTPPPPTATAVTPATEAARTEPAAPASERKADGEEWVTLFGKALQKNGIQLCSGVIIGVKHIDPVLAMFEVITLNRKEGDA